MEFLHGVRFLVPMKRRPVRLRYNMQRCGWSASVVDCIIVMQPPLPVLPRPSQASPTPLRFHASTPLRLYASTSPCLHVSTPPRLRASMLLHDCRLSCLHPRAILVSPISSDQSRRPYSHPVVLTSGDGHELVLRCWKPNSFVAMLVQEELQPEGVPNVP